MTNLQQYVFWAQAIGPVVTGATAVCIAGLVASISWRQAQTAHAKIVLDLFKDRASVLALVEQAVQLVSGPGYPADREPYRLLHEAHSKARFLFEEEIHLEIAHILSNVAMLGLAQQKMAAQNTDADWAQRSHDALLVVMNCPSTLATMMLPYMAFNHKLGKKTHKKKR